jgi:hypothetical protein
MKYDNLDWEEDLINVLKIINKYNVEKENFKYSITLICEYIWLLLFLNKWKKENIEDIFNMELIELQEKIDTLKNEIIL